LCLKTLSMYIMENFNPLVLSVKVQDVFYNKKQFSNKTWNLYLRANIFDKNSGLQIADGSKWKKQENLTSPNNIVDLTLLKNVVTKCSRRKLHANSNYYQCRISDLFSSTLNILLRQFSLNLAKAGDCQRHDRNLPSQLCKLYEFLQHRPIYNQQIGQIYN